MNLLQLIQKKKKMVPYCTKQKLCIVKEYYRGGKSTASAQRSYWNHLGMCDGPTNQAVLRLVGKFKKTGSVADERKGHTSQLSVRPPERVEEAWKSCCKVQRRVWINFHNKWGHLTAP